MVLHPINILSLCAGSGMLDIGCKLALPDARTVCYIEREAYAVEVLAGRMAQEALDDAPIWSDLGAFDGKPWRGLVDGVVGGIPCQPHSVAGKRLGERDPRDLWSQTHRLIGEVQPAFVFIENVPNIVNTGGLANIKRGLEGLGYATQPGIFSAAEVGASHLRKRLFVLALRPPVADVAVAFQRRWARGACPPGREPQERTLVGRPGQALANADGGGRELRQRVAGVPGAAGKEEAGAPVARGFGCDLAAACPPKASQHGSGCEIPLFAPGPADPLWAELLDGHPDLEPAICRPSDGLARGVVADRLRLTGNGVVPLAVAYALLSLAAALLASPGGSRAVGAV